MKILAVWFASAFAENTAINGCKRQRLSLVKTISAWACGLWRAGDWWLVLGCNTRKAHAFNAFWSRNDCEKFSANAAICIGELNTSSSRVVASGQTGHASQKPGCIGRCCHTRCHTRWHIRCHTRCHAHCHTRKVKFAGALQYICKLVRKSCQPGKHNHKIGSQMRKEEATWEKEAPTWGRRRRRFCSKTTFVHFLISHVKFFSKFFTNLCNSVVSQTFAYVVSMRRQADGIVKAKAAPKKTRQWNS